MQFTFNVDANTANSPQFYRLYADFLEKINTLQSPVNTDEESRATREPRKRLRVRPSHPARESPLETLRTGFEARQEAQKERRETPEEERKKNLNFFRSVKTGLHFYLQTLPAEYAPLGAATTNLYNRFLEILERGEDSMLDVATIQLMSDLLRELVNSDALKQFMESDLLKTLLTPEILDKIIVAFKNPSPENTKSFCVLITNKIMASILRNPVHSNPKQPTSTQSSPLESLLAAAFGNPPPTPSTENTQSDVRATATGIPPALVNTILQTLFQPPTHQ